MLPVLLIPEKRLPIIRPNHQVIDGTLKLDSQRAGYKKSLLNLRNSDLRNSD